MATRTTLSIPSVSALAEESKPALRLSPNTSRPQPLKPHGFKSKFKEIFKTINHEPGIKILSYSKKKTPIPEPVKTAIAANKACSPQEIKKFWEESFDEIQTPTDSLPPNTPLSLSYKKHLSRKYTYSSVFTRGETIKKKYVEPEYDFENWSYSEVSNQLPSVVTNNKDLMSRKEEDSDDNYEVNEFDDARYFDESEDYVREGDAYIELFHGAHSPNSADTESMHTVHNMAMLHLVNPSEDTNAAMKTERRLSSGHVQLLETYSDIMGEIGDLVPGEEAVRYPTQRRIQAKVANLEDLLNQMKILPPNGAQEKGTSLRPSPSTFSILNAYDSSSETEDDVPHEIIVEEYFIEHWVHTRSSDEVSSEISTPQDRLNPTHNNSKRNISPRGIDPPVVESGILANNLVAYSDLQSEFTSITGEMIDSLSDEVTAASSSTTSSDTSDSDNEMSMPEHLIISRVTKVVTLSRNKTVTNVEVKVEPLGKLEATPKKMLARESALNLKAAEQVPLKESEDKEKPEEMGKLAVPKREKRRSGLSQFLHFLVNH